MQIDKRYYVAVLILFTFISGCSNSLFTKYQDQQCVENCDSETNQKLFSQPVFQTFQMFLAESACWLYVYYLRRGTDYQRIPNPTDNAQNSPQNPLTLKQRSLMSIPAILDMCGTVLMSLGLIFVPVSVYQMTRGAVMLFVGLFSCIFLKRIISRTQWIGLITVFCGVFLVGLAGQSSKSEKDSETRDSDHVLFGILVIFFAQIFAASQFVFEEYLLEKYHINPAELVCMEGTSASIIIVIISIFINSFILPQSIFDLSTAAKQIFSNSALLFSSTMIMISIAIFNVCGLTITREISATVRSMVDTSRTLGIWAVSIMLGWETFKPLQLVGFGVLVYGTLIYNGIFHSEGEKPIDPLPEEVEHT